jgi:hypothetical protein
VKSRAPGSDRTGEAGPVEISRDQWLAEWEDLQAWLADLAGALESTAAQSGGGRFAIPIPEVAPAPAAEPQRALSRGYASHEMTLAVEPIDRFKVLTEIRSLLGKQGGVVDVRVDRLTEGIAYFRVHHTEAFQPQDDVADLLKPLGVRVLAWGERRLGPEPKA